MNRNLQARLGQSAVVDGSFPPCFLPPQPLDCFKFSSFALARSVVGGRREVFRKNDASIRTEYIIAYLSDRQIVEFVVEALILEKGLAE